MYSVPSSAADTSARPRFRGRNRWSSILQGVIRGMGVLSEIFCATFPRLLHERSLADEEEYMLVAELEPSVSKKAKKSGCQAIFQHSLRGLAGV